MKKTITAFILAAAVAGCGSAPAEKVSAPDTAVLKKYELQLQSNTERIEKLEKELSETKASMERMQRLSKQLGDSYDGLLGLFNEHKKIVVNLMSTLNKAFAPEEKKDEKKDAK